MAKSYKPGRLGEEIKKIISDMLLRELKDLIEIGRASCRERV